MLIEVCVDRVQSAINAVAGGAHRIELCQDLAIGGTTPSKGLVSQTLKAVKVPVVVMIRPRAADFCYDDYEFQTMLEDIEWMHELGVQGIVTGILTPDAEVDMLRMQQVMHAAKGMEVVFHRAFDMTRDLFRAIEDIKELGVCRVLTSGGKATAQEGLEQIRQLVQSQDSVQILPGGGINEKNATLFQRIGASQIHLSGKVKVESKMLFRNCSVPMGSLEQGEYWIDETSEEKIRAISEVLKNKG